MRQHQMTTRQVMITTALAAVVFWVAIALLCWVLPTGHGFLVVSVAIGCLFAVGSIRLPGSFWPLQSRYGWPHRRSMTAVPMIFSMVAINSVGSGEPPLG
jgi:hypothetical protein